MYCIISGKRRGRLEERQRPQKLLQDSHAQQDARYQAVHKRYLRAIGKFIRHGKLSTIKIKELSDSAHVWKSTFYDHFLHADDAINQFWHAKDEELAELKTELGRFNEISIEKMFSKILIFIYHNREYYDVVVTRENPLPIVKIVEIFRDKIQQSWSKYDETVMQRCTMIFSWEFSAEICYWGKYERFDFDRIPTRVRELVRLCQNATQRLA